MKKISLSPLSKKIILIIAILAVVITAIFLFLRLRSPKIKPLSTEQKEAFLNYVESQNIQSLTKKEQKEFLKNTENTPVLTTEQKDEFLKSIR